MLCADATVLTPPVIGSFDPRPGSAWRVYSDDIAVLTECTITSDADGAWLLAVWQNEFLTLSETCQTGAEAVELSNQIWAHFVAQRWVEVLPPPE
jgi:hypothetical protein